MKCAECDATAVVVAPVGLGARCGAHAVNLGADVLTRLGLRADDTADTNRSLAYAERDAFGEVAGEGW